MLHYTSIMLYDCSDCPAYCCGYPIIEVKKKDIRRLARHFQLSEAEAKEKFTEKENNRVRKMHHRADKKLDTTTCMMLNQKTRQCSIYKARPDICREHPGDRCEWYDRRLLESIAAGRRVIKLHSYPWTIDGDEPLYEAKKMPQLVEEYAKRYVKK